MRDAVTLACWPPGPDERLARRSTSLSGIAIPRPTGMGSSIAAGLRLVGRRRRRQRAADEPDRDEDDERRKGELEHALGDGVRQEHPDAHADRRKRADQRRLAQAHVAVPALAPGSDDRDGHDREQRRGDRVELGLVEEEDERRDEEDAAADPDQPADHSAREAERRRRDDLRGRRVHQPITSFTAIASSRVANIREIARSGRRCWTAAPITTPPSAGTPTTAALAGSTLPSAP